MEKLWFSECLKASLYKYHDVNQIASFLCENMRNKCARRGFPLYTIYSDIEWKKSVHMFAVLSDWNVIQNARYVVITLCTT